MTPVIYELLVVNTSEAGTTGINDTSDVCYNFWVILGQ
jgi:hypothetical protein